MVKKRIVLLRHGERIDRYTESLGKNWLETAKRTQDPHLSLNGEAQIAQVASDVKLEKVCLGTTKIFTSPFIRCVQSATLFAGGIAYIGNVSVEHGLVEDAKSMRGRLPGEKWPSWNPLILEHQALTEHSPDLLDANPSMVQVQHAQDDSKCNGVREYIAEEESLECSEVTLIRVQRTLEAVKMYLKEKNVQTVVLVSHGAVTKILAAELSGGGGGGGGGSDASRALSGKPRVASWSAFEQEHDGDNFDGWRPLYRSWQHSTILGAEKHSEDAAAV